jgi:predicted membrane-bound dolichyl-phosphate-mannose-protein mannosyltransferase
LEVFVALFSVLAVYLHRGPWLSGVLWGLAFASKFNPLFPFLCFLGHLLLRDRGSVVLVFVGLSLAFVAAHAVEAEWVFLYRLNYYAWLVSYHSHKNPPYGVDGAVFRGAVITTRSFSKRGCGGDGGF